MSQVYANPQEIRNFQQALRQFNGEVQTSTTRVHSQLNSLASTWRDAEYQRFSQELETVLKTFERYLQSADSYVRHLDQKARALESYQGR